MIQSATISRGELGLAPLSITSETLALDAEGVDGSGTSWRRQTVQSPFVHGVFEVASVEDGGEFSMRVWALGGTSSDLRTSLAELEAAVRQSAYTVTIVADDFAREWDCYRADYTLGTSGGLLRALAVPVNLTVPYLSASAQVPTATALSSTPLSSSTPVTDDGPDLSAPGDPTATADGTTATVTWTESVLA